ncbi:hypothetical protein GCM10023165_52570 [Variovorax defluvii]|uniref:histidine kinase n=2 Tax=Variovorax defluvii TaxID=913761 RepID=A0ABP8IFS5_9BURK
MGARMRAFDWRRTSLGDPAGWPQSLKTTVRTMLDSRFAMWMAWGPEGIFFCNDAYLPTVGIKRDWVLGARADRVWEEAWDAAGPRIAHVLATGEATWDEGLRLFLRRSGYEEETFHTFSYSPVYEESGRVAGMLCVVAEETERMLSARRLAQLQDLAGVSVVEARSLDDAGRLMLAALGTRRHDVSFATLYLAGEGANELRRVEAVPHPGSGLGQGADAQARAFALRVQHTGREALTHEVKSLWGELHGAWPEPVEEALVLPLAGRGGEAPIGALALGISTRRRLDDAYRNFLRLVASQFSVQLNDARTRLEAQQRAEALAELDRAKNLFFSNVSHELRTPLTLMLGPVDDLLARAALPAEAREPLERVQRNGLRLRKLVNTLLDFSRIEGGQVQGRYAATDLARYTAELASVFRSTVEQAGLRLVVRGSDRPLPAYVDREMWEKVVFNLLSNAFKFTFEGEIEVRVAEVGQRARLTVRDTGVGIEPSAIAHIFDRFHRVHGARSRTHEGTGIGLALVKELVRLHGGSIDVESTSGQGTCFTVEIPLGTDHLPASSIVATEAEANIAGPAAQRSNYLEEALAAETTWLARRSAHESPASPVHRKPERVLVVDDNPDMRDYVRQLLDPHWHVETAADGQEALATIAQRLPDLVVTDMMMPGIDGRALLRRLRDDPRTRSLPVLVLSAQAGEEARVAGLQQGADDYLIKPFSATELLARVEVQVMRARVHRQATLAREAAEAANRAKDEFIAMLGHELRNPLAPILTAVQVMKLKDGDSPNRAIIERQARHMARLVDDLLDISRIARGSLELRRTTLELRAVVEGAIETASPILENKRHRLELDVPAQGLPVFADEARLRQVIANLLVNAGRYTDTGGRVEIHARRSGDEAVLVVRDNGAGMAQQELEVVFDLFVQGAQGIHRPQGGLGLGLAIARNLTRLHGGTLEAASPGLGLGSEFTLRLPLAASAQEHGAALPKAIDGGHKRVLVVEDNVDGAQALGELLALSGLTPFIAHDGPSALALLQRQPVDVALLDIGLPVMDGFELATQIRRLDPTRNIRLIAMTGYGQRSDMARSQAHGFASHLVKPVDPEALLQAIG